MKLKKLILLSSSAMVCTIIAPLPLGSLTNSPITISAQESDELLLERIKRQLLEQEPIVEKELIEVKDEDLLKYYEQASEDLTWEDIYRSIVKNYPELKLIEDEAEYVEFKEILIVISSVSDKTLNELKNVNPKALIAAYHKAQETYENIDDLVASFIDELDYQYGTIETDQETDGRDEVSLSNESESVETPIQNNTQSMTSDESDQIESTLTVANDVESNYRQALIDRFGLTSEQLDTISSEELSSTLSILALSYEDLEADTLGVVYRQLVSQYPERFTTDQINEVTNYLRNLLLNHYPVTDAIAMEIADEDFLQWRREAVQQQQDVMSYIYRKAIENYPQLFDELVTIARENIMDHSNFTSDQLAQIEIGQLLLLDHQAVLGNINYDAVVAELMERYPGLLNHDEHPKSESSSQTISDPQSPTNDLTTNEVEDSIHSSSNSISIETSSSIESKDKLPQTGEGQRPMWLLILALIFSNLGMLLLKGKKEV